MVRVFHFLINDATGRRAITLQAEFFNWRPHPRKVAAEPSIPNRSLLLHNTPTSPLTGLADSLQPVRSLLGLLLGAC